MFRLYTKDKQSIHYFKKEKTLTIVTSSIYTHVKDIISLKIRFFSVREILVIQSNLYNNMGYYLSLK